MASSRSETVRKKTLQWSGAAGLETARKKASSIRSPESITRDENLSSSQSGSVGLTKLEASLIPHHPELRLCCVLHTVSSLLQVYKTPFDFWTYPFFLSSPTQCGSINPSNNLPFRQFFATRASPVFAFSLYLDFQLYCLWQTPTSFLFGKKSFSCLAQPALLCSYKEAFLLSALQRPVS